MGVVVVDTGRMTVEWAMSVKEEAALVVEAAVTSYGWTVLVRDAEAADVAVELVHVALETVHVEVEMDVAVELVHVEEVVELVRGEEGLVMAGHIVEVARLAEEAAKVEEAARHAEAAAAVWELVRDEEVVVVENAEGVRHVVAAVVVVEPVHVDMEVAGHHVEEVATAVGHVVAVMDHNNEGDGSCCDVLMERLSGLLMLMLTLSYILYAGFYFKVT